MSTDQELRETRLVFYRDDLERIDAVLEEFIRLSGCRGTLLIDKEGHLITTSGTCPVTDRDTVSALVAGGFSATRELARLLGEEEFTSLHHQGKDCHLQLVIVGDRTILTVIFDDTTTLGMVRLYVSEVSKKLRDLFAEIANLRESQDEPVESLDGDFEDSAKATLDGLFQDE